MFANYCIQGYKYIVHLESRRKYEIHLKCTEKMHSTTMLQNFSLWLTIAPSNEASLTIFKRRLWRI
jgi:hypothetical protein